MKNLSLSLQSFFIVMMAIAIFSACATQPAQGPVPADSSLVSDGASVDFHHRASRMIEDASNLTPEEKQEILSLQAKIRIVFEENTKEYLKCRERLVELVLERKYQSAEVEKIKGKIRDLEHQRTNTLFKAVDEANQILGRSSSNDAKALRDFVDELWGEALN